MAGLGGANRTVDSVILVGGQSRRMGTDKASLRLGDKSFLEALVDVLVRVSDRVLVVGGQGLSGEARPAVDFLPDSFPGAGPLGGLITGLAASQSDKVFAVACDMPLVTAEAAELLAGECDDRHDAAVPQTDGPLHPLCAVYRPTCLPAMRDAFERGERAVLSCYDRIRVKRVPETRLRAADPDLRFLTNINSWGDYMELISRNGTHHMCCRT